MAGRKGRSGARPTPTPILKLRGTWREDRHAHRDDARPKGKLPRRPAWLSSEAKRIWTSLAPILHKAGLLEEMHAGTLALLCTAFADFIEADRQLQRAGKNGTASLLITTSAGTIVENPLLYTRKRAWDQVFKAACRFGLTPADIEALRRGRPADTGDDPADELTRLLKKYGGHDAG